MASIKRKLTPIPFTNVHFTDTFWAPRIEINRTVTLPHILKKLEDVGRISAFDLNFEREVPSPIVLIFGDSDPAKWIEAASYSLATHPDPELEAKVDYVIDKIVSAQQPDGYLNTHFTHVQPDMRWKNLRDLHELYCAGHLIEAAVAHFQATGKTKLLDALCRYADLIDATFGPEPEKKRGYPGHPEIEMALVRLYHATGNERYLRLAKFFIDERGTTSPDKSHYFDLEARERGEKKPFFFHTYEYSQSHQPIREQEKVVGHAVRAMYLFSAVADLADEYDDPTLLDTCYRLWDNLINKRMYLTGGLGPSRFNEGFTNDYDLPDETAYAETCATVGLIRWNHRLLQFEGDRRFADIMERGLYNGFLSGVTLSGDKFYYENPLSSAGNHHHQGWYECPCCPANVARTIASLGTYFYSTGPANLWCHLYGGSTSEVELSGTQVVVKQETRYPWDGTVNISLELPNPLPFTMHLRVPGWCEQFQVAVNGEPQAIFPEANGYLALSREWKDGDIVEYQMEMPLQAVYANPAVRQLEGRVAIQRGPILYALEGVDHGEIHLDQISINPADIKNFKVTHQPEVLGGVPVVEGQGKVIDDNRWPGGLYGSQVPQEKGIKITAIPYCTWDNREPGEMRVWLRARPIDPT
jgi:DUF1680 family protein